MNRRGVILGLGTVLTAGCTGTSDTPRSESNDEDTEPTETPPSTEQEPTPDRQPVADARWVEEAPDELDPQSTERDPIAKYDQILALFDRAIEQNEWDPDGRSDGHAPEKSAGEPVSTGVSSETHKSIHDDLEDYEYWRESYPGWYFDHDGRIVTLEVGSPSK